MAITRLNRRDNQKLHQFLDGVGGTAENRIDFAANPACSGDVVQLMDIPNGALVKTVRTRIATAEGGTATADLGDANDPNGWNDAVNLNATAAVIEITRDADPYYEGRAFEVADVLDMTLDHDMDTGIVDVFMDYVMIERYAP